MSERMKLIKSIFAKTKISLSYRKKLFKGILNVLFVFFCLFILALSIRGLPGSPSAKELNSNKWIEYGPLELSPERGRYALLYSVLENGSFYFSTDIARFASPDVGYSKGHYVSLFAPTVSYIAMPGYIIGKYFGNAQFGSFAVIALFAVINMLLIRAIAVRLGAHPLAALIASMTFLFATPAFAYATTLYQHHISTFLILTCLYLLIRYRSVFSLMIIWILYAIAVTVDYPNFFMMLPVGFFALTRMISLARQNGQISISLSLLKILSFGGVILPMVLFLLFNQLSYGNPLQLSGTLPYVSQIDVNGKPAALTEIQEYEKSLETSPTTNNASLGFFQNRNILNGMYVIFLSPERGILIFTPVILLGFAGIVLLLKKENSPYIPLLIGVLGFNIVLYSMWGDPHGGWAYGARYIIPGYAILSIFIAKLLTAWQRRNLFLLLFFVLLSYSIGVNTLGALTSSSNPPKSEALYLEKTYHLPQPYTYQRNIELLNVNTSKSFVYQTFAVNYISAWDYYTYIYILLVISSAFLLAVYRVSYQEVRSKNQESRDV